MKLSKRAYLLILPVLTLGYLLAFLGVYQAQKKSTIELESLSLELQLAEVSNTLSHYSSLAKNYLYTFVSSSAFRSLLDIEDPHYEALVVEGGLRDAIANFVDLTSSPLSLTVYNDAGELEYVYEDGLDPFADIDPMRWKIVETTLSQGLTRFAGLSAEASPKLIEARIFDRNTLKPPVESRQADLIAIVVAIEAVQFSERLEALAQGERRLEWLGDADSGGMEDAAVISFTTALPPYGTLRVSVLERQIAQQLDHIKYVLGGAFLLITALSYLVLGWLLRRFITQPVQRLEQDLAGMSIDSDEAFPASPTNDEIGSLSRTFAGLFESLRESYQITRHIAERDSLTRLYNRHMFNRLLERYLRRAETGGDTLALLYIDIDNFKYINDKFGHHAGDELLSRFAERLESVLRPADLVCGLSENFSARLAGDEFAVILYGFREEDLPRRLAERILAIGNTDYLRGSVRASVSLSVGVACYPRDASCAEELICNADAAMYQAKNRGKNQLSFYSRELAEQTRRTADIESCLKQLDQSELTLHYMPIVDANSGSIAGMEALIRWDSPVLGPVGPDEFIPIAEAKGAFRDIDRWVIRRANDDLPTLQQHYGGDMKVSVNISSAELESREFVDDITEMVKRGQLRPDQMELEITETFHLNHRDDSEQILAELRQLGFSICIDDFGTGFTSLVQLVEYAIDKIKLDKSFVERVVERKRLGVIESLVRFCKSQNFAVTAEGIEHADQAALLASTGCDYLQGFYFMKPMSLEQLIASECPQAIPSASEDYRPKTATHR